MSGAGKTTGTGGLGCKISITSSGGVFLTISNLKLGNTAASKACNNSEHASAQISVLSLIEDCLMAAFKIKMAN